MCAYQHHEPSSQPQPATDIPTTEAYERRAPGWVIRCLKCGFTEPYGKYGVRIVAAGRPRRLHWCPRCRWPRCHAVERRSANV